MTEQAASERVLQCMEITGSNRALRHTVRAPGLDLWIDSRPLGTGGGGDVHYVSTCGAGYVTRLALADVSGHGESVDRLALALRKLMRNTSTRSIRRVLPVRSTGELAAGDDSGRFAHGSFADLLRPTRHLMLCNAGHGRPLWYSATRDVWQFLDLATAGDCQSLKTSTARYHLERLANLPLGILDPIDYEQFAIELGPGDRLVLCTDAITESFDSAGQMLGETGLLALVEEIDAHDPSELGEHLLAAVDRRRGGNAACR